MGIWRERLRFRRWGKWILAGMVGFVAVATISVEATSTSSFCNSCHIMEPFYDSWKVSSHKNVACVQCHIAPGMDNFLEAKFNGLGQVVDDLLHRTSNKPSASVSQFSCTRSGCHTQETLKAKKTDNGRFKFAHDQHLGAKHLGVEISCSTCHSHVKGDSHFEVNTGVCLTCHLVGDPTPGMELASGGREKLITLAARSATSKVVPTVNPGEKVPPSACTTCHDAPNKEIDFQGLKFNHSQFLAFGASCESCHQGTTATPPPIDDGRCLECHTFGIEKMTDSREMHRTHSLGRHKIECSSCHGTIRHGLKVQVASLEKLECNKCHLDQHTVQQNTYFNIAKSPHGPDSPATQNVMFMAHVDCTGCHTKARSVSGRPEGGAQVLAASPDSCDKCHQPGLGDKMIPLWQKTARTMYDEVKGMKEAASAAGAPADALARATTILDAVRADGSWGVHNPRYTEQLLTEARQVLAATGKVPAIGPASLRPAPPAESTKPAAPKPAPEPKPSPAPGVPR